MNLIRVMVFALATLLLAGGYLLSQLSYAKMLDTRDPQSVVEYAAKVDVPLITFASLIVLVACVVFTLFQEPKEEDAD